MRTTAIRQLVLALALFYITIGHAFAAVSMFYQPQLVNMAIENTAWPAIFKKLRHSGVDTMIFQWTRYDDAFSDGAEAAWLEARVLDAANSGLNIIIGLSSGSDTFQRLEQPTAVLPAYFRKIREKDRALVAKWTSLIPTDRLTGWYLPLEIDDKRWRQTPAREELIDYIRHSMSDINTLQTNDRPVYISSFFTGQMTPQRFAEMTQQIHRETGVKLWVQDGSGVGTLKTSERRLYLDALTRCQSSAAQGVIYELFSQVQAASSNQRFKAVPLAADARAKNLRTRAPCKLDTSYFGLNYIPPLFQTR